MGTACDFDGAQDTMLFLLQKADGLKVATQAKDGTTVLHRVAAASVRTLEPRERRLEEEVWDSLPPPHTHTSLPPFLDKLAACADDLSCSRGMAFAPRHVA